MSSLNDILIDDIETTIMSVLYANIDCTFTQYSLFNKLVNDKYNITNNNTIPPNFKSKFLLVLRNLMSKYDDIKLTKDNGIYSIVCLSSSNANPIKLSNSSKVNIETSVELDDNDVSLMYDYIYENCLNEYINWFDPFDGNSIFHELVLNNNTRHITRLVEENLFNYTITNNHNQTPVDLIKTTQVAKILTLGLIKNLNMIREILNQEKKTTNMLVNNFNSKMNWYESYDYKNKVINETKLLDIIFTKTKKYHFRIKMYLLAFIVCYLATKFIFLNFI